MADTLTSVKDICDIVSSVVTVIAVMLGGMIAWWRWGREKPQALRGNLDHQILVAPLDEDRIVLHVTVEIQNKGSVSLSLRSGWTEVRSISPVDEPVQTVLNRDNPFAGDGTQIDWPAIDRRTYEGEILELWLDSGETDRLYCDFVLSRSHRVVCVRSELSMEGDNSGTIWPITTLVCIDDLLRGRLPAGNQDDHAAGSKTEERQEG